MEQLEDSNPIIVSSIEFDKDQEFFAIAGVTKRIKIYDYNNVLKVSKKYMTELISLYHSQCNKRELVPIILTITTTNVTSRIKIHDCNNVLKVSKEGHDGVGIIIINSTKRTKTYD